MTDQGWMVDDGTCDLCVRGQCWQCLEPTEVESPEPGWIRAMCCCNEGYDLGMCQIIGGEP